MLSSLPWIMTLAFLGSAAAFAPPLSFSRVGGPILQQDLRYGQKSRLAGASLVGAKMQHSEHDILLRAARGETVDRSPVWLMRQAGRYMKEFREYSDRYPFRHRSETPEIAIELSLQPFRAFGTDGAPRTAYALFTMQLSSGPIFLGRIGVIMFSDILTPLPSMGIDFDVIKGSGPCIFDPIRSMDQVKVLKKIDDPEKTVPFLQPILSSLRKETEGKATLLGFIGAPFTLAAYSIEGKADKNLIQTKRMMLYNPEIVHAFLEHITDSIADYAVYQVESGAQVLQVFESWAHYIGPDDFSAFAKPYADRAIAKIKAKCPDTPVIYFANGGSSYLERQRDMTADMICVDWGVDMAVARKILGSRVPVSGNVDPLVLLGPEEKIRRAVRSCVAKAGGHSHILNLGHGVIQPTPEEAVRVFVDEAKNFKYQDIEAYNVGTVKELVA